FVRLLECHPWHPPAFGGQGVAGPHQGLFLHEHLLARSLPFPRRHDRRCVQSKMSFVVLHVSHFVPVHVSLLFQFLLALPAALYSPTVCWRWTPWLHRCSANGRYILPSCVRPAGGGPFVDWKSTLPSREKLIARDRPVRVTSVSGFRWPLEM